ncbi:MAG: glycerophosphodiester phosphodiesterase family protein [Pseudomonadota bacterium]
MTPLPEAFLTRPIAHRAFHDVAQGRPENSRAAVEAAIAAGYGIELDLQLSRDNHAMVFHDYGLDRLTGETGDVRARDASELEQITLTGGGEGVPTFPEILELVAGRVPLLIELKDQHGQMGVTDGALERAVADALQGYQGPAAVMSFNPNMVVHLADLLPDHPRGLVTSGYEAQHWPELTAPIRDHLRDIPDYDRAGCTFISHHAIDLNRPRVEALRASGTPVLCWTIRSEAEEHAARQLSDNITFERYTAAIPA